MTSYLQRRIKGKLFKQWVKESGLPAEAVPSDLSGEPSEEVLSYDIPLERVPQQTKRVAIDKGIVHLPVRYVVIMLSIIAVLLVTLSVVITILITRP
jgi:hypothetical protein